MIIVNGEQHPWDKGMTVADLLQGLGEKHNCVVVRINDKHVSRPNFEKFLVLDNAEIFLLPMIAGG